jgi:hypothetical protein
MKLLFSWRYHNHRTFEVRSEAVRAVRGRSSFQPMLQKLVAAIFQRSESCKTTSPPFSTPTLYAILSGMSEIDVDHKLRRGQVRPTTSQEHASPNKHTYSFSTRFTQAYVHTVRSPSCLPLRERKVPTSNVDYANGKFCP